MTALIADESATTHAVPALSEPLADYVNAWETLCANAGCMIVGTDLSSRNPDDASSGFGEAARPRDLRPALEVARDADLVGVIAAAGRLRRQLDAAIAFAATELADRSTRALASESVPRQLGFRNTDELVSAELGVPPTEAKRFTHVGEAVAERRSILGELLPPEAEHLAEAVECGKVGLAAADEIVSFRWRMRGRAAATDIDDGEATLTELAAELPLRDLRRAITHLEAHLDQDGLEPRIDKQIRGRSLRFRSDADGMVHLVGRFDPVTAAPIRVAINHLVTQHLRTNGGSDAPGGESGEGPVFRPVIPSPQVIDESGPKRGGIRRMDNQGDEFGVTYDDRGAVQPVSVEERSLDQLSADALAMLCKHAIGCESDELPRASTTVTVRMPLSDLRAPADLLAPGRRADATSSIPDSNWRGIGRDSDTHGVGPDSDPHGVERDSDPRGIGRDSDPRGIGRDSDPRGIGRDSDPRGIGPDPDPHGMGRGSDQLGIGLDANQRGIDETGPIDATRARLLSAAADIIPMVLGTQGEVLDLGRRARHFSRAQRIALVERDGGCAFCGLPASMTEAHHIRWWRRDYGRTDLANGVLLCSTCHHRMHEGWDVEVTGQSGGGTVWFTPPHRICAYRIPRLGGRKRFDPVFRRRYPPDAPSAPSGPAPTADDRAWSVPGTVAA